MPKRDFYDDPEAPAANSLVVAVAAIVIDDDGRLLMIKRYDNGLWALPGGAQDLGESTREAVVREVREETGIDIDVTDVSGIYSDPRHVIAYDDGEVRQEFSIVFHAKQIGGELHPSIESTEVRWIEPPQLAELDIDQSMRLRVVHGLEPTGKPFLS